MKIKCLSVSVYRDRFGDCTNGGISSHFRELLLACPDGPYSFDPDMQIPVNFCMVVHRNLGFTEVDTIYPATVDESGRIVKRPGGWMFGGNIADTTDSRFREMTGHFYPLHIHDRQE